MIYVYLCRQLSNKRPFSPLLLDVRADCQNSLSPSSVSRPPHGASAAHLQGQVRGSLTAACHIKTSLTIFDTFTSEKDHESMIQKSFPAVIQEILLFSIFYPHFSAPSGRHRKIRCTPHRRRHVDEKGWEVDNFTKRGA